jgi:hypothetical protein
MHLGSIGRALALGAATMMLAPFQASALTWDSETTISDDAVEIGPNSTAMTSTSVVVGFRTDAGISVRRSADAGTNWLDPVQLSTAAIGVPALAASGTTFDAVWVEHDDDGQYHLMHRRSSNDGATWSPAISISHSGNPLGKPSIAREARRVAVTWSNLGKGRIYVVVSTDGGGSWGAPQLIGATSQTPLPDGPFVEALPDVSIATERRPGDDIHRILVSFNDHPSTFRVVRSVDDGASWSRRGGGVQVLPGTSIAARGKVVLVGYTFDAHGDSTWVEVRRSTNGGYSFGRQIDAVRISEPPSPWSEALVLSVRGSTFRAAFTRCINGGCAGDGKQVLYTESTSGGRSWSDTVRVFRSASAQGFPVAVDVAGGSLIVAYRACVEDAGGGQDCDARVRRGS